VTENVGSTIAPLNVPFIFFVPQCETFEIK